MDQHDAQAETRQYTAAEYSGLSDEEKSALRHVADHLGYDGFKEDDECLSEAFNLLRPCDGCVPDEETGDDVCVAVRAKFAAIFGTAAEMAEEELKRKGFRKWKEFAPCVLIDPSWEDRTSAAIVDYYWEKRPYWYFQESAKAWHFQFARLRDIVSEVLRARDAVVKTFLRGRG